MLKFLVYILSFISLLSMTLLLVKNLQKNRPTRIFTWLVGCSLIWISALAVADFSTSKTIATLALNIAVFFFSLLTWLLLAFSLEYSGVSASHRKWRMIFYIFGAVYNLIFLYAALNILVVEQITIGRYGASIVNATSFYNIHILQANSFAVIAIANLNLKKKKFDENRKRQIGIMTNGLVIAVTGNILSGVVSTYLPNAVWLNLVGTFSMTVFIVFIGYAVIKHRLFDIRSVVARSLAYTLSVVVLGSVYALAVYGVGGSAIDLGNVTSLQRMLFALLALIMAATFHTIIMFFNRITNRLFFRDAYDTQIVLKEVSSVIVGSIDSHKIQNGVLGALSESLKPTFMGFVLAYSNGQLRQGHVVGQHWSMGSIVDLQDKLKQFSKKIVTFDDLEGSHVSGREFFQRADIGAIAPLVAKDEVIGYLILGLKKSGDAYNKQDTDLLGLASNELAVALQNAQRFEEIQAFNITLQQKVAEATREVKKTNRKLVALDEAKDEFISMASHQLRTPLTSIKGYLSMMVEGDLGKVNAAQEKALKEAFGSSQRMVYLIADFLNVSRIKTGKFVIETKEVDLPQVVGEEITQLREMAASRDIALQYEAPGVFPRVKLDDNKIRQVMMNIVDNAIYYTPSGGTVTIQLYVDAKDVVFKVVDTGIGVPKREQHKLFTKFFRAGNARKARPDGTGLGLFMAQKIIVEQGGSIIFESTEGKGSTFGFRFPLSSIKV